MQEQYQEAGWKIVEDLNEKFIDLCVDDNSQEQYMKGPQQVQQFRQALERLNFKFDTKLLDLPEAMTNDTEIIEGDMQESLCAADAEMGQDLDALFSLLNGETKEQFTKEKFIVEHQWNDQTASFE